MTLGGRCKATRRRRGVVLVAAVGWLALGACVVPVGGVLADTRAQTPGGRVRAPESITAGPDGSLWFTDLTGDQIGRMTVGGEVATFRDTAGDVDGPREITAGPDGNLWFTSTYNDRIGRIAPDGTITTFEDPADDVSDPWGITAGPDGNVWFTSNGSDRIGRITPDGKITTFEDRALRAPLFITDGADGALYVTTGEPGAPTDEIGRITPEGEISISRGDTRVLPEDIAADPANAGKLWFTGETPDSEGLVGRLDTGSGEVALFGFPPYTFPISRRITVGPDHNAWFTYDADGPHVGRTSFDGSSYEVVPFTVASAQEGSVTGDITVGPDGNLWFLLSQALRKDPCRNKVGRVTCSINRITLTGEETRFKLG